MDIDVSKFIRRKPDMSVPKDIRTEDDMINQNVKGMIRERLNDPEWDGGICLDNYGKGNWASMTFKEKCDALYDDTMYWMKRG